MDDSEHFPPPRHRRHPARGVFRGRDVPTVVFLTVCVQGRRSRLLVPEVRLVLEELWRTRALAWMVSDYVLMPDHLHLFCQPGSPSVEMERWVAFWKDQSSKALGWPKGTWQRDGFHHRIRSREDYEEKWIYMRRNPIEAGLVANEADWPHFGRVHEIGVNW